MFDSLDKKIKQIEECYNNLNYTQVIEVYEQISKEFDHDKIQQSFLKVEGYYPDHMLGQCYCLAEVRNKDKAVEFFTKAIDSGHCYAKSWLAFCYIFGDGVPEDLQKALTLFKEANKETTENAPKDHLSKFMLCHLIDNRILLELWRQRKNDDIRYALADPIGRRNFTTITSTWTNPLLSQSSNRIKIAETKLKEANDLKRNLGELSKDNKYFYDSERLKTLSEAWERVFGSLDDDKYYNAKLFEWIKMQHYKKGWSKERIINTIDVAAVNRHNVAKQIYDTAFNCLTEYLGEWF
ncbi:MAG: hypothetical protein LBQ98_09395 [Nitrososphaerota archaeon]|nr:hypothetical protein [Nitrososphaerota archaeon]